MRNKYPGICYRCHKYVAPGQGHPERLRQERRWRVQHVTCCLRARLQREAPTKS